MMLYHPVITILSSFQTYLTSSWQFLIILESSSVHSAYTNPDVFMIATNCPEVLTVPKDPEVVLNLCNVPKNHLSHSYNTGVVWAIPNDPEVVLNAPNGPSTVSYVLGVILVISDNLAILARLKAINLIDHRERISSPHSTNWQLLPVGLLHQVQGSRCVLINETIEMALVSLTSISKTD